MKIRIISERWSIPDYRNGETAEDSVMKRLEIESDGFSASRYSENMEDEEIIVRLNLIKNIVDAAIKSEKKRLENANKKGL